DLNARELGLLIPLLLLMLFMGVYPRVFLDRSQASVEEVRARLATSRAGGTFAAVPPTPVDQVGTARGAAESVKPGVERSGTPGGMK
ncbi:MAG TPA: hypothetical protein VE133_06710, partial [Candidatus Sulfotelmatobacter sp.]|nr:hypothetical protein [Candidatus Sulfotelmatobacter sp.]